MHAHIVVLMFLVYIADSCLLKCCVCVINTDGIRWYTRMNVEDVKL